MATLLRFPERDKGRKRRRNSQQAMGDCSLMIQRNEPIPPNVVRLAAVKPKREPSTDAELSLLLATAIFAVLPKDSRADLLDQLRCIDLGAGDRRAAEVLDIIDKRRW